MANPRAFISFDFDYNISEKNLFIGQSKHSKTPFNIEDWSSKEALPQNQWEKLIRGKISRCHMVIVLVGKHMTTATGVSKEIKMAKDLNVPVFGVYVRGANSSSSLPKDLSKSRTIHWNWDEIASAIDKAMNEGKNANKSLWDYLGTIGTLGAIGIVALHIILNNKKA
ncbi:MAG: TIR domain-containing protein [Ktedonobacteraceae bacterium]